MRRKISVLAAVLLAIGLTACGNDETQATHDAAQTVQAASSEEVKTTDNTEEEAQWITSLGCRQQAQKAVTAAANRISILLIALPPLF